MKIEAKDFIPEDHAFLVPHSILARIGKKNLQSLSKSDLASILKTYKIYLVKDQPAGERILEDG